MNKTAGEYADYIEGAFVRLAQALHGHVNSVAFANVTNTLRGMSDGRMDELKCEMKTTNDWEVLARFVIPGLLAEESIVVEDKPEDDPD